MGCALLPARSQSGGKKQAGADKSDFMFFTHLVEASVVRQTSIGVFVVPYVVSGSSPRVSGFGTLSRFKKQKQIQ